MCMPGRVSNPQVLTRALCCIVVLSGLSCHGFLHSDTASNAHLVGAALSCLSGAGSTGGKGLAAAACLPFAFEEP